ncbi:MAG: hypothetical protein ACLFRV_10800 [Acidimicrobiales bacterium]
MSDGSPELRVWTAVLDRIEAALRQVDPEGLLDLEAEFEAIGGFDPPEGMGAMPEALHERARQLLEAVNATVERVAAARDAIGSELAGHRSVARRPSVVDEPPAPSMVDHNA